jgi:hypothetical protein
MSLTRANVESILVKRCGRLLTAADLDGSTVDGTNADLNDPIGWAVRQAGYTVTDITAVADADLASVATTNYDELLDLAELRALETILGNLDDVNIKIGPRSEDLSDLARQVEKRLELQRKKVELEYGYGVGTLEAGVITLEIAEHYEGTEGETLTPNPSL